MIPATPPPIRVEWVQAHDTQRIPAGLREAVLQELAVPGRYRLTAPSVPIRSRTWLEVAWAWVADRWNELYDALSKRVHLGVSGRATLGDLLIVLFSLIVAFVGARLLGAFQMSRQARFASVPLAAQRNAHALMVQAVAAAERGEYVRAIRILFTAAVTLLDLRGLVHDDASATINELRRALREHAAPSEGAFLDLARAYASAAYAERPADAGLWERARAAYDDLVRSATA